MSQSVPNVQLALGKADTHPNTRYSDSRVSSSLQKCVKAFKNRTRNGAVHWKSLIIIETSFKGKAQKIKIIRMHKQQPKDGCYVTFGKECRGPMLRNIATAVPKEVYFTEQSWGAIASVTEAPWGHGKWYIILYSPGVFFGFRITLNAAHIGYKVCELFTKTFCQICSIWFSDINS